MAENPRFNNSGMFKGVSDDYSEVTPNSTSEVLATQGNVINSIKVFWNNLKAKLAYAVTRSDTTKSVGSNWCPIYVDGNGEVKECNATMLTVGIEGDGSVSANAVKDITTPHTGTTAYLHISRNSATDSNSSFKINGNVVKYVSGVEVKAGDISKEDKLVLTYATDGSTGFWVLLNKINTVFAANAITTSNDTTPNGSAGIMSVRDKAKLDGIAFGANKYTLEKANFTSLGGIKLGKADPIDQTKSQVYPVQINSGGNAYVYVPWTDTDTNTHCETKLAVTDSDTANTSRSASNGYVHLNLFDDSTQRNSILLKGSGRTTVTSTLENEKPVITVDTIVTLPTALNRNSASPTLYSVKGPIPAEKTVNHFLRADGTWSKVSASMGSMSASISNGALDMGSNLNATLKVTYNGSPIQFAFINNSYHVSNSSGELSIGGVKASSAITHETTAVIVPMNNLSLKPQVVHFITKDNVEFLD